MIFLRRYFVLSVALIALAAARYGSAAQAFIIVDSKTGYILQEQESQKKRQVGSLTKIATAAVVLDWVEHKSGSLTDVATIPPEAFLGTSENHIGFQPGDRVSARAF